MEYHIELENTLRSGDYDSFVIVILSQNHRKINIAELISVSKKVIIGCQ